MPRPRRASPLTPDERRKAIAKAVAPLLIVRGPSLTTKEMAEAAGVAEGTLFTVFPDKAALLHAAIDQRMDPEPIREGLAAIPRDLPLEAKLSRAAEVIGAALDDLIALGMALRAMPQRPHPTNGGPPSAMTAWTEAIHQGMTDLLEPHEAQLRLPPKRATAAFVGLHFASRRHFANAGERLTTDEITGLLLKDPSALESAY